MGYRQIEHKHRPPNRTAQKTTTRAHWFMENGETFSLAIPCWYQEVHKPIRAWHHCRATHDHLGWPNPDHVDHSCQDHDFPHCHNHHETYHHDFGIECHNPFRKEDIHHHHHHYVDMSKLIPIHLSKEGYNNVTVNFDKQIDGLDVFGYIDSTDDWVIRLEFKAFVEEAIDKPVDVRFVVRVSDEGSTTIDTVSRGVLTILPAPIEVY